MVRGSCGCSTICSLGVQQMLDCASGVSTVGSSDAGLCAGMPALVKRLWEYGGDHPGYGDTGVRWFL